MFLNDVHILYYLLFIVLGIIAGQFSDWIIKRSPDNKKIFSKEIFTEYKKNFKPNYILIIIMVFIYCILLATKGISR